MSEKGLQKLTLSQLKSKKEIHESDLEHLTKKQRRSLENHLTKKINNSIGSERDAIIKQAYGILTIDTRNDLYEYNHRRILKELHTYVSDNGYMPTVVQLSELTELSRQTVTKHLKEFKTSRLYQEEQQKLDVLVTSVLGMLFKMSMRHDLKACKLFLEYTAQRTPSMVGTYIDKQQNNFSTILTPEIVDSLTPEQIIDIEAIIVKS